MTITAGLNEKQRQAVEHAGGPLLVLAGPGTGKTGVLVERIAHLVGERGVSPERVLALTFSRRAADGMRARVTARLPEAQGVEV
ncbi:MAG: UvrD-helicase domain-containing protein, partial [Actinomycetota bacterium]|nr:UvrD-helicase domain-containing protein [Actinomycetota bacterium]